MALLLRGQSGNKAATFESIPVVDLRTLNPDSNKTCKTDMDVLMVPLFTISREDGNKIGSTDINDSIIDIFRYSYNRFVKDDKGKEKVLYGAVEWGDSGIRVADGEAYNDPGFELGLTLDADERTNMPGIGGAPDGPKPAFSTYTTLLRVPILWNVTENEDGDIDPNSGTLMWLELNPSQYRSMTDAYGPAIESKKKLQFGDEAPFTFKDEGRGRAIMFSKRPNEKAPADINKWILSDAVVSQSMFDDVDEVEEKYNEMLQRREKQYRPYMPTLIGMAEGSIDIEAGCLEIFATNAAKFLEKIGELPEGHEATNEEIRDLFFKVQSKYTQAKLAANIPTVEGSEITVGDDSEDAPF